MIVFIGKKVELYRLKCLKIIWDCFIVNIVDKKRNRKFFRVYWFKVYFEVLLGDSSGVKDNKVKF